MSTQNPSKLLDAALQGLPRELRKRLIAAYLKLKQNLAESRYDAAGMDAGKLAEIVLRILQFRTTGSHLDFGKSIHDLPKECRDIIQGPLGSANPSEHTIIPRAIVFLYTIRNKRGIGHAHGEIDANQIDAAVMARVADWVICEFVRIHYGIPLEEAQGLVDQLAVRRLPDIWEVAGRRRVLRDDLSVRDSALYLLYASRETDVLLEDLIADLDYSNPSTFKKTILTKLHRDVFLNWDRESDSVVISPKGIKFVEENIIPRN